MRALVIDDDPPELLRICLILRQVGIETDWGDSGELALELLGQTNFNVVLLNPNLRDIRGHEVLRRMRAAGDDTPVMVLSDHCSMKLKLHAFSAGADDYLTIPFDDDELVARIQAIIHRHRTSSAGCLRAGPLIINQTRRDVRVDGRRIELTNMEYEVLELLVLREGITLTKEAFLVHLYNGKDVPEKKIIDVFICKLRKKLAVFGIDCLIQTVWGSGYILRDTKFLPNEI